MSDFWKDKRVLVTGGAGFLGSHVVEKLKERGAWIYAPRSTQYDLTQYDSAYGILGGEPEIVFHLAAKCGGIGANAARPADFYTDNLLMGANVIRACKVMGIEKLVLVGTTCSYPKDAPLPLREENLWDGYPEETNAPYGIAKRTLLTMAQAYRQQYGLNSIYLIPANLYGPRDNFDLETGHVIPAIIRKCAEAVSRGQETVSLWGDGTPTREFLYVEDCAEAIILAAEHYDQPEPVNIGHGKAYSIHRIASMIASLTGFEGEFVWETEKPNGQRARVLSVERMQRVLAWEACYHFVSGLQHTVDWYKDSLLHPDAAERFQSVSFPAPAQPLRTWNPDIDGQGVQA